MLKDYIEETNERTVVNNQFPVLTASKNGVFLQDEYFKKQVASKDNIGYKIVHKGDFTYRAMSDTGYFYPNRLDCAEIGIVSPAYPVFRITKSDLLDSSYLKYYFKSNRFQYSISKYVQGSTRTSVKYHQLASTDIDLPNLEEQRKVVSLLDKTEQLLVLYNKQLSLLDNLVKSRFVELFGDPVDNPKGWEKKNLSEEAEIKIGPFGSLLHKEDYITGGHALINPSHIIDGNIAPDEKLTISDEKYDELSVYQLKEGDVVMGRRGEMGRCAVVEQAGLLCGTGSLLIRTNGNLSADFIQKIISFPSFRRTIEDMAVGQTMPNLNVPIVSAFQIIKPPKKVQEEYYSFVDQVDKSKLLKSYISDEKSSHYSDSPWRSA